MIKPELLSCPECDSDNVKKHIGTIPLAYMQCMDCKYRGPLTSIIMGEAERAWNSVVKYATSIKKTGSV